MSTGLPRPGVKYSLCCELATHHYPSTSAFVRFSSSLSLETCIHSKLTQKKLSGIFLVLIIKSVRWPSLWRECFWENTLQNRWDTHKSQQFSSSRFPGITNIVSPVLFSTALDSHLFSPTFPNFIPCAHHYSTYCQTIAERLRPVRYF